MNKKRKNTIPRIFHGPENICGIGRNIADWQRKNKNAESDFIVYEDNTNRQNSHYNHHLEKNNFISANFEKFKFFFSAIKEYDLFHFYFGKTLLPLSLDLPILRLLGKKIIMDYVGSDIRLYKLQKSINPYYHLRKSKNKWDHFDFAKRMRMVWQGLWFHYCLAGKMSYRHALTSIPKRKIINYLWVNTTLDVPENPPGHLNNKTPFVIHAPTNRHTKGTVYIEKAVKALKEEGLEFDFQIYQKVPHDEFVNTLKKKADIVIDQLLSGGFGVLAMEAMTYGKPVCGFVLEEVRKSIPDLPIVQCTVDTLKENLKDLILNKEKREEIGRASWEFARKYFNRNAIYEQLWQIYLDLYNV